MSRLFKLLLLTAFFNSLTWIVLIPLWQYPDEQSHFAQVQNIAEIGTVPYEKNSSKEIILSEIMLGTKRNIFGENQYTYNNKFNYEYSDTINGPNEKLIRELDASSRKQLVLRESTENPPLYYKIAGIFYSFFNNSSLFERNLAVRFFSAILFLFTILIFYQIGSYIFDKKIKIYLFTTSLAFMPMYVYSSTGVLPDPLVNLLFALLIYVNIKIFISGVNYSKIFFIILIIVLGTFTRQNFFLALPIELFTIVYYMFYKKKLFLKILIPILILIILLPINTKYGTKIPILSYFRIPDATNIFPGIISINSLVQHFIWTANHTYREVLPWYWGVYRWLSYSIPDIYYEIINRFLAISLVCFVFSFIIKIKKKRFELRDHLITYLFSISVIYFVSFALWDYFFRINNGFTFGVQGRYFYPLICAHFAIALYGIFYLLKIMPDRLKKILLVTLGVIIFLFNDLSLFHLTSTYYDMESINSFVTQASQYKAFFIKGNSIMIIIFLTISFQIAFLIVLCRKTFITDVSNL